jgi:hypothetical protein
MTSRKSEAELTTVYSIILAFFIVAFSAPVYGQNKTVSPAERKKTAVNFEDQLIQGELNKPEFFYFLQRKQFNFGRLIKFRENFLLEMKKTTEQIERKGSSQ